jgi:hypothetical protein
MVSLRRRQDGLIVLRRDIMNEWLQENGRMKRKAKAKGNKEINEVVWEWFTNARS